MNSTFAPRATALVLSVLVTIGTLASANGIATRQFAAADAQVLAQGTQQVAVQHVVVIGHRLAKA